MCENEFMRDPEATPLDMIKALGDPIRIRIMSALGTPRTVKQVGDHLGEDAGKLYYHVKELYRVGLVELVETRVVGGVAEKYYKAVKAAVDDEARQAMSDLADKDPAEAGRILGDVVNSLLASVLTEFSWTIANLPAVEEASISIHGRYLRLTHDAADRLAKEADRIVEEAIAASREEESARNYMQVDLLFPIRPEA